MGSKSIAATAMPAGGAGLYWFPILPLFMKAWTNPSSWHPGPTLVPGPWTRILPLLNSTRQNTIPAISSEASIETCQLPAARITRRHESSLAVNKQRHHAVRTDKHLRFKSRHQLIRLRTFKQETPQHGKSD